MTKKPDNAFYTGPQADDFGEHKDPYVLFDEWMKEAEVHEPSDANAMALATVDKSGLPNVRMVLLKGIEDGAFVFYTNLESAKGRELGDNPKAALNFHWKSLRRQIRIRGPIARASDAQADAYFASRARGSRIGAWASRQSRPLESRFALEKAVAKFTAKYGIGEVPRPDYWSGFCLTPYEMEFWHDRPFRLHDRVVFRRDAESKPWSISRLYP
ncbi:MAG: pyridoxamine 5'-phosphate oxidase [Hyphomicrobiaceae bacterium]|nr:pyridoxamine 5'-phosphate oxidase [Hyphomicrobiaceae bacterium]